MIKIIKDILPKDKHYYFALSMGVDSLAACHYLLSKNYNLTLVHFNHNLRPQNDQMQDVFLTFCKDMNVKAITGKGSPAKTESDCRSSRLSFYKEKISGELITAHHVNDWVESYLLNCFRGKPENQPFQLKSDFRTYSVLHPFLLTRKADFIQYAHRNHIEKYLVQDETNKVIQGSRRNWVRNVIVPEMNRNELSLEKYALREVQKLIGK